MQLKTRLGKKLAKNLEIGKYFISRLFEKYLILIINISHN